ncbi:anti-sigma factor domain-containing protein [Subtercola sp. RTI3]|uniref:anti-sigma factor n=1 Tax=Subtercola sp. RTI3 TaxID=3048639 RepID=UPI002B226243|nr:anti-sigma factor [Subtercola sp. RTI3]MEA9985805.1 anti-sigma factor [Subtercola sp. RTI3]
MTKDVDYLSSGAYALNALTPDEARAFEQAMRESPDLATESDDLLETAVLLALAATPVEPSAGLKSSIMAKLAETAQDAPLTASLHSVSNAAAVPLAEGLRAAQPESAPASPDAAQPEPLTAATAKAHSRWFSRPVGALVAAAAAVALFVGGGVVGSAFMQNTSSTSQQAAASSLAEIYAASDVESTHSTVNGGGEATVLWSSKLGKSAVVATGLPSLPSNKTYEAWYINGSNVSPAGTFTPGGDTTTWHVLTGTMTAGDTVGVTVEPAGGSQKPTTNPILAVPSVI